MRLDTYREVNTTEQKQV